MNDAMPERWLPVVGYEGLYQVSDQGRILSMPRATTRGGILKQATDERGAKRVNLTRNGDQRVYLVHRLMAEAFLPPRPEGMDDTRHLDGDPSSNVLTNLAYGTRADNMQDMLGHGRGQIAKTRCPQDHEYTEANTIIRYGRRWCRECARANGRKQAAAKAARTPRYQEQAICPQCGTAFEKTWPNHRRKYCTDACSEARLAEARAQKRPN